MMRKLRRFVLSDEKEISFPPSLILIVEDHWVTTHIRGVFSSVSVGTYCSETNIQTRDTLAHLVYRAELLDDVIIATQTSLTTRSTNRLPGII